MDGMPEEIETLWSRTGLRCCAMPAPRSVDISTAAHEIRAPCLLRDRARPRRRRNLARYDGVRLWAPSHDSHQGDGITEMYEKTRAEGFGDEVQRRVMIGTYVLSAGFYDAYYNRARRVRDADQEGLSRMSLPQGIDSDPLTPATPSAAFGLGEMASRPIRLQMYLNDVFTVTVNLAGVAWHVAVPDRA